MTLSRREILAIAGGAFAAAGLPAFPALASGTDDAVAAFTGGAAVTEGGVDLTAPEIAENGNTVPIAVDAPGAVAVAVFAEGNPNPEVVTFRFGPLAASQSAATRIRLAKTQNVIAVAQMGDGSWATASAAVKVTIGGCGG